MPGIEYRRLDLSVVLRRTEDGAATIQIGWPGEVHEGHLPAAVVERWLESGPDSFSVLLELIGRAGEKEAWTSRLSSAGFIVRIALDVADPELAALAWESSFADVAVAPSTILVRVSPVRPRALSIPFTLPIRALHIEPFSGWSLEEMIQQLFAPRLREEVNTAVQAGTCSALRGGSELDNWRSRWATAEVLHFDHFLSPPRADALFSTANPDEVGTLGWLARLSATWQTRLVVLNCPSSFHLPQARRLAQGLVNRGGPAVLVACSSPTSRDDYERFYSGLVHDMPLDQCWGDARFPPGSALFVGAGREESLRVSTLGQGLVQLAEDFAREPAAGPLVSVQGIRNLLHRRTSSMKALGAVRAELHKLHQQWGTLQFELSEGVGLVPLANRLKTIRQLANAVEPGRLHLEPSEARRFVNSSIWGRTGKEDLLRLDRATAQLSLGETYHLGIQIGPEDDGAVGAAALLEEAFKWEPGRTGVWLEVGVTGIDFQVLGDPVQELWLPRDAPSERIFFAVVPRAAGVSRLRYCVYYRQHVLQSFRLAALTEGRAGQDRVRLAAYFLAQAAGFPPGRADEFWYQAERQVQAEEEKQIRDRASQLAEEAGLPPDRADEFWRRAERMLRVAEALDVPLTAVGDVGYLARLEYSLPATVDDISRFSDRPARALSIVANDLGGAVLTFKAPDFFAVRTNAELPAYVTQVRQALESISVVPVQGVRPDLWPYAFSLNGQLNTGSPDRLKEALQTLAQAGWRLFDQVIPRNQREEIRRALAHEKQIIHVAHVLLEKVIPWAAIYDRPYDADKQHTRDNKPVAHDACLAALPRVDSELAAQECGKHPDCLLHPARLKQRSEAGQPALCEETVACPLRFWGFRHLIEVPPQQIDPGPAGRPGIYVGARVKEQSDRVLYEPPLQLAAGFHSGIPQARSHREQLEALVALPRIGASWQGVWYDRDDLLEGLKAANLDLVYLFCHASRRDGVGLTSEPYLEFQAENAAVAGHITADNLDYAPWPHHPLVVLNGCRTVGQSVVALSPFITKLVQDREAAGVLGTEIQVWEQLAMEAALLFLGYFLTGDGAGEALLKVRRAFLARNNPLGLIYTLYAAADLKLERAPIGVESRENSGAPSLPGTRQ